MSDEQLYRLMKKRSQETTETIAFLVEHDMDVPAEAYEMRDLFAAGVRWYEALNHGTSQLAPSST